MRPAPSDLAAFVQGLEDELLLPALWLIRRSGLGAILTFYEPDERAVEIIDDRLFTSNRRLYEFVQERMEEN
jgi:hypothetical protein